jgi:hypothetical protein
MNTNEMQQIPLVIGVTGHRDLVDAEILGVRARIEALFSLLKKRFPRPASFSLDRFGRRR